MHQIITADEVEVNLDTLVYSFNPKRNRTTCVCVGLIMVVEPNVGPMAIRAFWFFNKHAAIIDYMNRCGIEVGF